MTDFLRTEPGQRMDQPDFEHGTQTSQIDAIAQSLDALVVGDGGDQVQDRNFIIRGWASTNPVGATLRVTKDISSKTGIAMVGFRNQGEVKYGWAVSRGEAFRDYSLATYADGTYGVYIRLEFRDNEFQNRLKWDPFAGTPIEVAAHLPTRIAENWGLTVELTSPGPEWVRIAEVVMVAGAINTLTDKRDLFYEGTLANAYQVVDSEWGGGNDRSDTRETYGIFGMRRAFRAIFRQLQDIIGDVKWWVSAIAGVAATGVGPRSLTQLNAEKLGLTAGGAFPISGDLHPAADITQNIGVPAGDRWRDVYCRQVDASLNVLAGNNVTATVDVEANADVVSLAGDVLAFDALDGDRVILDPAANPAPTAPVVNAQYDKQIARAWATITCGVGGPTIEDAVNIDSAAYVGTGTGFLQVDFAVGGEMADTNYTVEITEVKLPLGEANALHVFGSYDHATGSFRIMSRDLATAALTQLDTTTVVLGIVVWGAQ